MSLNTHYITLTGQLVPCIFEVNQVVLARIAGAWREVKIIGFDKERVNNMMFDTIVAAWEVPDSSIVQKARFVPMADKNILPNTPDSLDRIKAAGHQIKASNLPQGFVASMVKVTV